MRPTQHISNNRVLGAPPAWDQNDTPCMALPITDAFLNGLPTVKSYWKPTPEELQALNRGEHVVLWSLGHSMSPTTLSVEP